MCQPTFDVSFNSFTRIYLNQIKLSYPNVLFTGKKQFYGEFQQKQKKRRFSKSLALFNFGIS